MKLITAAQEFLTYCEYDKQLNSKTLKAYRIDLNQTLDFLNHEITIDEISKETLLQFFESKKNMKPKSLKRKVATLKALFNYLESEDKVFANPFRKLKFKIREQQTLRSVLDIKEVVKILKESYSDFKGESKTKRQRNALRNFAVLELLFNTGARVSEISNLRLENVDLKTGVIKIHGKGNKERTIKICNSEAIRTLNLYYDLFRETINTGRWFLVNNRGMQLSDQSIRNSVKKISKKAGIHRKITPHVFRHTFATLLLENNVDLKYIQSFLGHSSIMTTQIYTHVNSKQQERILSTKHPRREFVIVGSPV